MAARAVRHNTSVAEAENRVAAARAMLEAAPPAPPAGASGAVDPEPLRQLANDVEAQLRAAVAREDYAEAATRQAELKPIKEQLQQAEKRQAAERRRAELTEALQKEEETLEAARRYEEATRARAASLFTVGSGDEKRPWTAAEWVAIEPPLAKVGLTSALILDFNEGKRCSFWFVRAAKLRRFSGTAPPRLQELRRDYPNWLEQREISFSDGHARRYVSDTLVVSHCWEEKDQPDAEGVQFRSIKEHLFANEAIEWVWFDFWSMPQGKDKADWEEVEFSVMLPNINLLYLFCSVLILLDSSYMSRFWTQFEAFLSFRKVTANGLGLTPSSERRDTIKCIHNADPEFDPPKLRKLWGDKTTDEAYAVLEKPDVKVTNQRDKRIQLPKLKELDTFAKRVIAEHPPAARARSEMQPMPPRPEPGTIRHILSPGTALADAPFPRNRHIFALGGFFGKILSTVEALDLQTGAWVELEPMGCVRNCPAGACCVLDSGDPLLYVCGGFDGRALSTTAECYDPSHGGWIDVTDMGKGRYGHAMVVLDGLIYAIGGSDDDMRLVECYDPSADAWAPVAPMLTPRRFTAAAVVDGKIYVVGGRDATRKDLASVECYDPQTDAWTAVAPMGTPRKNHGVAVLGGKLYAVGGLLDAVGYLASVEVYFPATNTWSTVPPMGSVRKQHGVAAIGGKLYAVGGDAVEGFTSTEAFDPLKNRWEPVAPMGTPRLGHAVFGM